MVDEMRGGPTKPKYKLPIKPGVEFQHIVMVGLTKYTFDTKEEAEAFHYFLKRGVPLDLALDETKRLKDAGELSKDENDDQATGGFGGFK